MLEWFVSPEDANEAITGGNLQEEECVKTRPEKVPNCCIDEIVNLHHVKKYFTGDAWLIVRQILETKGYHVNGHVKYVTSIWKIPHP